MPLNRFFTNARTSYRTYVENIIHSVMHNDVVKFEGVNIDIRLLLAIFSRAYYLQEDIC